MGIEQSPRSPAIHRAVSIIDAVWSGRARTPAALADQLPLSKSSVFDLLNALQSAGLVDYNSEGLLETGGRWAAWADPTGRADRILRACARNHELDGHTVSVARLVGNQILWIDVRPGQKPLVLNPRPGQYSVVSDTAAGLLLSETTTALGRATACSDTRMEHSFGMRINLGDAAVELGHRVSELSSPALGAQIAARADASPLAATVHLPVQLIDPMQIQALRGAISTIIRS